MREYKTGAIDDPLGLTHSLANSKHCVRLKLILFCYILKSGDGRSDNLCENYRPWLWVGLVDQKQQQQQQTMQEEKKVEEAKTNKFFSTGLSFFPDLGGISKHK